MILLIIIVIIILVIIYLYDNDIIYYDYGNTNAKHKICIIAGVHGNEPAASILLNKMIQDNYFENINKDLFIRIIPSANRFGLMFNSRYQNNIHYPDINRNFVNNGLDNISKEIIELTKDMDLILDFHEGWGFHQINSASMGSTITISPGKNMEKLGNHIIRNLNNIIPRKEYKFILRKNICKIKETLGCYSTNMMTNYILVETTGQNDIQKLEVRQEQIKNIIETVLNNIK